MPRQSKGSNIKFSQWDLSDCLSTCDICSSASHRDAIVAAVTLAKTLPEFIRLLTCVCSRPKPWLGKDQQGRSILHMAASLGRIDIMAWYLTWQCRGAILKTSHDKSAWIDEIDGESGWTALHRAMFHGEIAAVGFLLKNGADNSIRDYDGYTPLQILIQDQLSISHPSVWPIEHVPQKKIPMAFYTWGSNCNYTLGYGTNQTKSTPEKIRSSFGHCNPSGDHSPSDVYQNSPKGEIHVDNFIYGTSESCPNPVLDVVLRKFHTLFLTPNGVFSCGHGQGGRLGHREEKISLTPAPVEFPSSIEVTAVAAGLNHSVFLDTEGAVYTCGFNVFFQLGLDPPPEKMLVPALMSVFHPIPRSQKKHAPIRIHAVGIAAERCHTMFWTQTSLFVVGFNAGQLGPRKDRLPGNVGPNGGGDASDLTYVTPKELTEVKNYFPARFVRCSDAAMVICSSSTDLVVLHDYQIKRFPKLPRFQRFVMLESPYVPLTEICVFGGNLHLPDKEGSRMRDLIVVVLLAGIPLLYTESKKTSFWSPITVHGIPRDMSDIYHISVSSDQLMFSTDYGECYTISLKASDRAEIALPDSRSRKAERIPKLWRAIKLFSEPGGRSFAAVQLAVPQLINDPKTPFKNNQRSLSQSSVNKSSIKTTDRRSSFPTKPDVELICDEDDTVLSAHRTLLSSRIPYFQLLLEGERWQNVKRTTSPILPCDKETGQRFLDVLYCHEIKEPLLVLEDCVKLLKLADFIMDDELRNFASGFFRSLLSTDNVFQFMRIAELYSAECLKEICLQLLVRMLPGE